jgi:hypothetical protein
MILCRCFLLCLRSSGRPCYFFTTSFWIHELDLDLTLFGFGLVRVCGYGLGVETGYEFVVFGLGLMEIRVLVNYGFVFDGMVFFRMKFRVD